MVRIARSIWWPFPLLILGVLALEDPVRISIGIILALIPASTHLIVLKRSGQTTFIDGLLTLFVLSALVGTWISYDIALSLPMFLTLLGSVSLVFAIVNSTSPQRIGIGLVIAASLVAFYFISQYAYLDYQDEVGPLIRLGRATGSLLPNLVFFRPHPNAVATFLAGSFPLSLALTWHTRGAQRIALGLAAAVIAFGLLVSESRGAWLGLALAFGIGAILMFDGQRLQIAVGGLALILVTLLGLFALAHFIDLPTQYARPIINSLSDTVSSRLTLYRNSLYLWGDYPFTGIGLGNTFALVYSRYQLLIPVPFLYYAHNIFLSVLLGQGLLGLVALIWLIVEYYRFVLRVERLGLDVRSLLFFRAAWVGITATLLHGLTDSTQFSDDRWTILMLFSLLGLTLAMGWPLLEPPGQKDGLALQRADRWQQRWPWLPVAAATTLFIIAGAFWRPLISVWYTNVGAIHQTRADLSPNLSDSDRRAITGQAVAYFERALNLNPSLSVANRRMGMVALGRQDYEAAVKYLEKAYQREADNQATLKALGYAYLWTGKLDLSGKLFQQIDFRTRLMQELTYWHRQWNTRGRKDLSDYAQEMVKLLSTS